MHPRLAYHLPMPQKPKSNNRRTGHRPADRRPTNLRPKILRPTILLTGFGPFPGIAENISGRLIVTLAKQARAAFPDYRIHSSVLPTEWHTAPKRVTALFQNHLPVLALHFGVTKEANGFRLETQGLNLCRSAEDAAGRLPLAPKLVADGEPAYAATLAVETVAQRLQSQGWPVSISDDAGGYLCNAVFFQALHTAAASGLRCRVGFIHIPPDLSRPPLTFEAAVAGSLEIIRCGLE
jgi:pyroglutamyl-peptidase